MDILAKLANLNPYKISLVGGEPLLYGSDIFNLVEYGRSINKRILFSITTNGILLFDNNFNIMNDLAEELINHFDWITFSLDGCNNEIQSMMSRNSLHHERIMKLLKFFLNSEEKINIKVNTIVSKVNQSYDNLKAIADILIRYKVKRWKLMKFLGSRGMASINRDTYSISDDEYEEIFEKISQYVGNRLLLDHNNSNDYTRYITISSEGNIIYFNGASYEQHSIR
jgi:MoaA/NifB/PqqE/SkfB family radical SAM enzyme